VGRRSTLALAAGCVLLLAGVAIGVVRHNRSVDSRARHRAAQKLVYDNALRRAMSELPRFEISYVRIPLATAQRLSRHRYTLVETEVARRLRTGRPPLHPDFAALAGDRTDVEAQTFKAHLFVQKGTAVIGLLVTQITPGGASLRLRLARLRLTSFVSVWDALDVLATGQNSIFRDRALGKRSRTVVVWRPRLGETDFVPLSLFHVFWVPRTAANESVISAHGQPRRLEADLKILRRAARELAQPEERRAGRRDDDLRWTGLQVR